MNVLKICTASLAILVISGCISGQTIRKETKLNASPDLGILDIYARPSTWWQSNVKQGVFYIHIDGKQIGEIGFSQRGVFRLKPGSRKLEIYVNDVYPLVPWTPKIYPDYEKRIEVNKGDGIGLQLEFDPGQLKYAGNDVFYGGGSQLKVLYTTIDKNRPVAISFSEAD